MNAPLRDLLTELAEEQPTVVVDRDLYARGRRARRRGLALRVGAGVAVVGVGAGLVTGPLTTGPDGAPRPAASGAEPAMPTRLHPVPDRLAPHEEDGYTWHPAVRADGLAIGPTAAVFPANGGAVMAVSALDGGYRGLELPGFDESSYFRFEDVPVALSPDGTRMAWTWNPDVISGPGEDPVESGIRIAHLETGEVIDVEIPSQLGVYAHGFGWSPDGRYLAYELETVTGQDGRVSGSRSYRIGRLDTKTGQTIVTPLASGIDAPPGVSDDGAVAISAGGYNGVWVPGRGVQELEGPFESVAWSPDGTRTALASLAGHLAVGTGARISREVSPRRPADDGRTRVLGWPDDSRFAVLDERAATVSLVSADLEDRRTVVRADGVLDLYQLSVAVDLLDQPTRDVAEPHWPTDWESLGRRAALGIGAFLAGVGLVVSLRRRA